MHKQELPSRVVTEGARAGKHVACLPVSMTVRCLPCIRHLGLVDPGAALARSCMSPLLQCVGQLGCSQHLTLGATPQTPMLLLHSAPTMPAAQWPAFVHAGQEHALCAAGTRRYLRVWGVLESAPAMPAARCAAAFRTPCMTLNACLETRVQQKEVLISWLNVRGEDQGHAQAQRLAGRAPARCVPWKLLSMGSPLLARKL